jgi:phage/plasmid primase-like uncharacterized protein
MNAEYIAKNELGRIGLDINKLTQKPKANDLQHGKLVELFSHSKKVGAYLFRSDGVPYLYGRNYITGQEFKVSIIGNDVRPINSHSHSTGKKEKAIVATNPTPTFEQSPEIAADLEALWDTAEPLTDGMSGYLTIKAVKPWGLRVGRIKGNKNVLIDYRTVEGDLVAVQKIYKLGGKYHKLWEKGSKKTGAFKALNECAAPSYIYLGEGYATVASIYQWLLTDRPELAKNGLFVSVGDCANLAPCAVALMAKYPKSKLVILADNDLSDVGEKHAIEAIKSVGRGCYLMPTQNGLDFSDLWLNHGGMMGVVMSDVKTVKRVTFKA